MDGEAAAAIETPGGRLRVLVVTAEPLLAFGIERLLEEVSDIVVATAETLGTATALAWRRGANLLLLDPASSTPEELRLARRDLPSTWIALWARSFSDELVIHARALGVTGFLTRTAPNHDLVDTIRELARGGRGPAPAALHEQARQSGIGLSRRQSQIVGLLAQGLKNREVAAALGLTEGTVKSYMIQLLRKTGARDRFELAILGLKNAWPTGEAIWTGGRARGVAASTGRFHTG